MQSIVLGIEAIKSIIFSYFSDKVYPEIDDLVKHFEKQERLSKKGRKELMVHIDKVKKINIINE